MWVCAVDKPVYMWMGQRRKPVVKEQLGVGQCSFHLGQSSSYPGGVGIFVDGDVYNAFILNFPNFIFPIICRGDCQNVNVFPNVLYGQVFDPGTFACRATYRGVNYLDGDSCMVG